MVKNTGVVPKRGDNTEGMQAKDSIGNHFTNPNLETIDIVKQMGDLLPADIARLINEYKPEDPTDWFCKKFSAKPIPVENAPKKGAKEKEKEREAQRDKAEKEQKEKLLEQWKE